jgi:hypothetical protein
MRVWGWPVRLAVVAAIVIGLLYDASRGDDESQAQEAAAVGGVPLALPVAGTISSTWYCPTVVSVRTPTGGVELTTRLRLGNRSDADVAASITYMTSDAEPETTQVTVPAAGSTVVDPPALAGQVSAIVEGSGPSLVVERLAGNADVEACAPAAGTEWYFGGGDTSVDAVTALVVFNPFAVDAVVDLVFATEAEVGPFTAVELEGFVVPARTARQIDLTESVRRRASVATALVARSGEVVLDRIVSFDGSEGRTGLSLSLAAPATAERWVWPAGRVDAASTLQLHMFNPNDEPAEVDIAPQLGGGDVGGLIAEPIAVTVEPHDQLTIQIVPVGSELAPAVRLEVTPGVPFGLVVESANGVPIIADVETAHTATPAAATTTTAAPTTTTTTTTTAAAPTTSAPAGESSDTTATTTPAGETSGATATTAPAGESSDSTATTRPAGETSGATATTAPGSTTSSTASTTTSTTTTTTTTTTTLPPDPSVEAIPERRAEAGADLTVAASRRGLRWLVIAPAETADVVNLVVHNGRNEEVPLSVTALGPGGAEPVAEVTVPPVAAVEIPIDAALAGRLLVVEASAPVVVGMTAQVAGGSEVHAQIAYLLDEEG